MEFSSLLPLIRPDGKDNSQVGMLMGVAGILGLTLARLPIGEWMGFAALDKAWFAYGLSLFVGYAFIGYIGIGQLYMTWLIHKKCKALGGTMKVKELL